MSELIDFSLVSVALLAIGIYGLAVKRNAIRMLFAVEIVINEQISIYICQDLSSGVQHYQPCVAPLSSIMISESCATCGFTCSCDGV